MSTEQDPDPILLAEFFESTPPGQPMKISDLMLEHDAPGGRTYWQVNRPDIQLHCDSEVCNGLRIFENLQKASGLDIEKWQNEFVMYRCRNCQETQKLFAVGIQWSSDARGLAFKFGELPPFGPPVPARVIRMVGKDRELFLKGRRCENQGLGIRAFSYYRRVVENQKALLLGEIRRVAHAVNAGEDLIRDLEKAADEIQFTKAIEHVKHAIPEALLIKGRNPLTLLHTALSEGVHELDDADCLERAQAVRVVLTELAERAAAVLKDDAELNRAVSKLLSINSSKNKTSKTS